ncbi:MAG: YibE/F family protein [Actinobacteria bacterium]|nr:YibE/F family protein [Actinomycetota bacterium]
MSKSLTAKAKIVVGLIISSFIFVVIGVMTNLPQGNIFRLEGNLDAVEGSEYILAEVVGQSSKECVGIPQSPEANQVVTCEIYTAKFKSNNTSISEIEFEFDSTNANYKLTPGSKVQLLRIPANEFDSEVFLFMDVDRTNLLIIVAAIFSIVTLVIGKLRGLGAIIGLISTFFVLLTFLLPSLLEGKDPLTIAVISSSGLVLFLLYIAHGISIRTSVAVLGTLFGIILTAILSLIVISFGNFSGISSDDDFLLSGVTSIRLDGLLLAGIIFASVGVLNDVTVTQASSVWEIKNSNPKLSIFDLFRSGMRIGRDHIASTVYTLLFTYTGAALPTLLLIFISDRPTQFILSSEAIAQEIVRTLVGSIGLVLAVPITTILAAILAEKSNNNLDH